MACEVREVGVKGQVALRVSATSSKHLADVSRRSFGKMAEGPHSFQQRVVLLRGARRLSVQRKKQLGCSAKAHTKGSEQDGCEQLEIRYLKAS